MEAWRLPREDLEAATRASAADLGKWLDARVLVTGGTGALGAWIVHTLLEGSDRLGLGLSTTLVTRRPASLPRTITSRPDVELCVQDVRTLETTERFDLVVHGAAGASAPFGRGDTEPRTVVSTIVDGTRRVLEVAARTRARVLFLSSGAVYGARTAAVAESDPGGPDPLDPRSAYGEAKRLAELLVSAATAAGEVEGVIARLFAFVGPGIPLDSYFAAGNFVRDLRLGGPIVVEGDGRPLRSYLYCGDLPEWCFALATRGRIGQAYNVGSPEPISIAALAELVSTLGSRPAAITVREAPGKGPAPWYVPAVDKARDELGLEPRVALEDGLRRWIAWLS